MRTLYTTTLVVAALMPIRVLLAAETAPPDYHKQIAPIFKKYCVGCHNEEDQEGELVLSSYQTVREGGAEGPIVVPGDSQASRLIRVLTGLDEPTMPPEDSEAPSEEQIALLRAWIDAGAKGPLHGDVPDPKRLDTPHIEPSSNAPRAVTGLAYSPDGSRLAVARFGEVQLLNPADKTRLGNLAGHPGKVNCVSFSTDGSRIVTGSGVAGLYGEARTWTTEDATPVGQMTGHNDTLYAATLSPDNRILATASYDGDIILWDSGTGQPVRILSGHNGAIFDLAFSPDGRLLASASGDATIKIWQISTGMRLDTLNQPTKEQYAVAFSPDGRYVVGGGADNRIRMWRVVSRQSPAINPIRFARFAHEGPILTLCYSKDGRLLASASEDRTVKVWDAATLTAIQLEEAQPEWVSALAISPDGTSIAVGRTDGSLTIFPVQRTALQDKDPSAAVVRSKAAEEATKRPTAQLQEQEPNDTPNDAMVISVPAVVTGVIDVADTGAASDVDLFRFTASAGQKLMLETRAARDESPLDSVIEVLDTSGGPVVRELLQAVRDSYLTFHGTDSFQSGEYRLRNWEEMELNEYLYLQGEVVKLYQYPRGPDSGFLVYPGSGHRWTYFGTTAVTHALGAPCYIVRPRPPGANLVPNGLPVFPIYYRNDDDSLRKWGNDSRLQFTAPSDGTYLVRVRDARGFSGPKWTYQLTIRPPKPDFHVSLDAGDLEVQPGCGKGFTVKVDRTDGFLGPVQVEITGMPPGFSVTSPIEIQAGHYQAHGMIFAAQDAPTPTEENSQTSQVTATATVDGSQATKSVASVGQIKLAGEPKLLINLDVPDQQITIAPGQTVSAVLRVERRNFADRVKSEAQNLPHGVYVDNIGLNGILVVEGKLERTIYITAAKWVPETSRTFFIQVTDEGNPTSPPVTLHVRKPLEVADNTSP